jgi:RNA polymerase sigma-70 factor (ECF subfamily)
MSVADASPEDLARAAQRGSTAAFESLVERFQEPLYNVLSMRTRNPADAEELAQEAFLRAWQRIETYDERWRFSTWLFAVARNLSISRLRAEQARPDPAARLVDVSAPGGDPSGGLTRTEARRSLWEVARRVLSAEQCDALWLRYAEDLTPLEIARVLGRRPSTIRVLLFRARARLAEHVDAPADAPSPGPAAQIKIAGESR